MLTNSERRIADQVVYEGQTDAGDITEEVIKTYCEVIGIDFEKEKELLWIAEEGARAPIPDPCRDTNSGEFYYFNFQTGESQWDHPLDEFYSEKVIQEREKLKKKTRVTGKNAQVRSSYPESHTEPFQISPGDQQWLSKTSLPDVQLKQTTSSPMKEDGKRFLKKKASETEEDFGFSADRGEKLVFDLDDEMNSPTGQDRLTSPPLKPKNDANAYEDDYEEDVDFGDGDDRHLSEFLLEKESALEPELANLASTGEHETVNSQFSHGIERDGPTNNSLPMSRPQNPLADNSKPRVSMTATSFDASEFLGQKDPAELENRLKEEFQSVQLEMLEEHDSKVRQLKTELEEKFAKEELELNNEHQRKLDKFKEVLKREEEKEKLFKEDQVKIVQEAKRTVEEESKRQLEELKEQTSKAAETERQWLENRDAEISKRLATARTEITEEVNRKLSSERTQMEAEYAARVASLRKEMSALHDAEMSKLRTQLEEANYREQEAKKAELRSVEQRASSVKVLESEMGVSLDRRKAELHSEHEHILAQIRRENERAVSAAKREADLELKKIKSESTNIIEETRQKISEETERLISAAKTDGERARTAALARIGGIEENLKSREDEIAKKERELNELDKRVSEKERMLKKKQDELKRLAEDQRNEEENISKQKRQIEKMRSDLVGLQNAVSVDEIIKNRTRRSRKGSTYDDSHSMKSSTGSTSRTSSKRTPKSKRKLRKQEVDSEESNNDDTGDSEDEPTILNRTKDITFQKSKKNKTRLPKFRDLLPMSSESSGEDEDLGRNGNKVRKILLKLLFPHQKLSDESGDDEDKSSTQRSKPKSKVRSQLVNLTDDEEESIDLTEIRSRIRSERLGAFHKEQHSKLESLSSELKTLPEGRLPIYSTTRRSLSNIYSGGLSTFNVDRYLSARWYQLYKGSALSANLPDWQWPIASSSTKYGHVSARQLLLQYSASKLPKQSDAPI